MERLSADTIDPVGGFMPPGVVGVETPVVPQVPVVGFTAAAVAAQREREALAGDLRPFLSEAKIDREKLREALQKVYIKQMVDALEANRPYDVRESGKVLMDLAGMKSSKVVVEATRGHSQAELDAFREAGKAGAVVSGGS